MPNPPIDNKSVTSSLEKAGKDDRPPAKLLTAAAAAIIQIVKENTKTPEGNENDGR